jgi:hypothetical protein
MTRTKNVLAALEAGPMGKNLYLRIVSAVGFAALAALFVTIDPFLSAGANLTNPNPAVSVNRSLKGDRLPLSPAFVDVTNGPSGVRATTEPRAQIPFACDAAVSLIRSPKSAPPTGDIFRRCMA